MNQHLLDNYAQTNAISQVNPVTKILLGIGTLLLVLLSQYPIIPIISAITLSIILILFAKIPSSDYLRILSIPAGFTLISVTAILFLSSGGKIFWEMPITPWMVVTISQEGIDKSIAVLFRVVGGTVSLLFISLTTPFTDIINLLNRCRVPQEMTDLMTILYRNIFILLDQATQIHAAQIMRLGYSQPREAAESFGMLCGSLFISSWNAGDDLIRAMDCRCYDGKFASLTPSDPVQVKTLIPVLLFLALLLTGLIILSLHSLRGGI